MSGAIEGRDPRDGRLATREFLQVAERLLGLNGTEVRAVEAAHGPLAIEGRKGRFPEDRLADLIHRLVATAELVEGLGQSEPGDVRAVVQLDRPAEVGGGCVELPPTESHRPPVDQEGLAERAG